MQVFFPYDNVRLQQKEIMGDVADCLNKRKVLVAQAPTGLGKTVSSLAPAIAYARENGKKIFFLTPKSSQHKIVFETINLINEKFGLDIKAVDLVGKKQMCLDPFISHAGYGFYEACNKKKKESKCTFYNNSKGKTPKQKSIAARNRAPLMDKYNKDFSYIKEICSMHSLCPYEITLELAKKADVIVCDYAHLFNSDIRENLLTPIGLTLEEIIVIIDEAHNLPSRIRDIVSSNISLDAVEKSIKEAKTAGSFEVEFMLNDVRKEIVSFGKKLSFGKNEAVLAPEDFDLLKRAVKGKEEAVLETADKFMAKAKVENCFLLAVWEFLHELLREKENTMHVIEQKNGLRVSIYPLDIEQTAGEVLNYSWTAVLMSGTLVPLEMYKDVLGIKNSLLKEYESPFPKENRLNLFVDGVTTKYTSRGTEQYALIGRKVSNIISKVPGNSIVFFPSFEMLENIAPYVKTSKKILIQKQEMSNAEKNKMITEFKSFGSIFGGVMFAVSGGSIAEGVDFPGENLLCAIVIGIPFAKANIYSEALIRFYNQKLGKGFDYGYIAPAMNKALQAAGRVIRAETDKGICVFLDERFADEKYKKFFPKNFAFTKTSEPEKEILGFF